MSTPPASTGTSQFAWSVTERGSFRDCRRKWKLEAVDRLASNSSLAWPLIFGNAMHAALEDYYGASFPDRDLPAALKRLSREFSEIDHQLQVEYAGLYSYVAPDVDEHWNLGKGMLQNYDLFDRVPYTTGLHTFRWERVEEVWTEERGFVEILNPTTRKPLPGRPLLSAKPDIVVRRGKDIWVVDHKNYQRRQSSKALDVDDQLTAYCYVYWRQTGVVPKGCVLNVLIKDLPTEPKRNKDGSLSQNRSQKTTYDAYVATLEEDGITDLKPYTEYLRDLKAKGWSEFFAREPVSRTKKELISFEERLYVETLEAQRALAEQSLLYPNPSQRTCGICGVLPICRTMEERGDVDFVIKTQYHAQDARYTIPEELSNASEDERGAQARTARKGSRGAGSRGARGGGSRSRKPAAR